MTIRSAPSRLSLRVAARLAALAPAAVAALALAAPSTALAQSSPSASANQASNHAGMGGAGFGLRYKPAPYFGIEGDVDFVGGRDYNGYRRGETAFTLNALFFVNPKSKTQLYFLAGFGWAGARVDDDRGQQY